MDLRMQRVWYNEDGIVSNVFDADKKHILTTLEHAYPSDLPNFKWLPKVLPGTYECVRGLHALHNGIRFETFELMGVIGHKGILFHHGNWNRDSEGCILTGDALDQAIDPSDRKLHQLVTNTNVAFGRFMEAQAGLDRFLLRVMA